MRKIISNILFVILIPVALVTILSVSYLELRDLVVSNSDMMNMPLNTLSAQNEAVLAQEQSSGEELDKDICSLQNVLCPDEKIVKKANGFVVATDMEGWENGIASYYTVASSSTVTASGEEFRDDGLTVACLREYPLHTFLDICNDDLCVVAECNDRGGFGKLGRVLDFSTAVKDAIGCSDLCHIKYRKHINQ